jgi:hypothetical protein
MNFNNEGHKHTLKGLHVGSLEIIFSHHMEKILKKGHLVVIGQFNAIQLELILNSSWF